MANPSKQTDFVIEDDVHVVHSGPSQLVAPPVAAGAPASSPRTGGRSVTYSEHQFNIKFGGVVLHPVHASPVGSDDDSDGSDDAQADSNDARVDSDGDGDGGRQDAASDRHSPPPGNARTEAELAARMEAAHMGGLQRSRLSWGPRNDSEAMIAASSDMSVRSLAGTNDLDAMEVSSTSSGGGSGGRLASAMGAAYLAFHTTAVDLSAEANFHAHRVLKDTESAYAGPADAVSHLDAHRAALLGQSMRSARCGGCHDTLYLAKVLLDLETNYLACAGELSLFADLCQREASPARRAGIALTLPNRRTLPLDAPCGPACSFGAKGRRGDVFNDGNGERGDDGTAVATVDAYLAFPAQWGDFYRWLDTALEHAAGNRCASAFDSLLATGVYFGDRVEDRSAALAFYGMMEQRVATARKESFRDDGWWQDPSGMHGTLFERLARCEDDAVTASAPPSTDPRDFSAVADGASPVKAPESYARAILLYVQTLLSGTSAARDDIFAFVQGSSQLSERTLSAGLALFRTRSDFLLAHSDCYDLKAFTSKVAREVRRAMRTRAKEEQAPLFDLGPSQRRRSTGQSMDTEDAIEFRTRLLARGDDLLLGQKPALAAEFYSLALNYDLKVLSGSMALHILRCIGSTMVFFQDRVCNANRFHLTWASRMTRLAEVRAEAAARYKAAGMGGDATGQPVSDLDLDDGEGRDAEAEFATRLRGLVEGEDRRGHGTEGDANTPPAARSHGLESPLAISAWLTAEFVDVFQGILDSATSYLGLPRNAECGPGDFCFAVLSLGSMSQGCMSLYSDVEFAVLVSESTKARYGPWMDTFLRLVEGAVIALGETSPDPAAPIYRRGFAFDDGGNTPIVKASLLDTPQAMVDRLLTPQSDSVGDLVLLNMLCDAGLVFYTPNGGRDLFGAFRSALITTLTTCHPVLQGNIGQNYGRIILTEAVGNPNFRPVPVASTADAFNIKERSYRLYSLLISAFSRLYGVEVPAALTYTFIPYTARLGALTRATVVSHSMALALRDALEVGVRIRALAHATAETEADTVVLSSSAQDGAGASAGVYVLSEADTDRVKQCYHLDMFPTFRAATELLDRIDNRKDIGQPRTLDAPVSADYVSISGGGDSDASATEESVSLNVEEPATDVTLFVEGHVAHIFEVLTENEEVLCSTGRVRRWLRKIDDLYRPESSTARIYPEHRLAALRDQILAWTATSVRRTPADLAADDVAAGRDPPNGARELARRLGGWIEALSPAAAVISAYYEVAANLFQVRRVYLDWATAYDDASDDERVALTRQRTTVEGTFSVLRLLRDHVVALVFDEDGGVSNGGADGGSAMCFRDTCRGNPGREASETHVCFARGVNTAIEGVILRWMPVTAANDCAVAAFAFSLWEGFSATVPSELLKVTTPEGAGHMIQALIDIPGWSLAEALRDDAKNPFEHTCHTETHPAYPDRADYLAAWQGSDMFSELVISLIILNPEAGSSAAFRQCGASRRVVGIQNEFAFVPSATYITGGGLFGGSRARGDDGRASQAPSMLSVIFCLDGMTNVVAEEARSRFLSVRPEALLQSWLRAMTRYNNRVRELFTEDEMSAAFDTCGCQPLFAIAPSALQEIFARINALQTRLAQEERVTHLELLSVIDPISAAAYASQIGRRDIGPDERYANIVALSADARQRVESEETARHAPVASVFRSPVAFGGRNGDPENVPPMLVKPALSGTVRVAVGGASVVRRWADIARFGYTPEAALEALLGSVAVQRKEDIQVAKEGLLVGDPVAFLELASHKCQEKTLEAIDFAEVADPAVVALILRAVEKTSVRKLHMRTVARSFVLPVSKRVFRSLRGLVSIDLSNSSGLASVADIAYNCPLVESLVLRNIDTLEKIACPRLLALNKYFPSLRELDFRGSRNLASVTLPINAPTNFACAAVDVFFESVLSVRSLSLVQVANIHRMRWNGNAVVAFRELMSTHPRLRWKLGSSLQVHVYATLAVLAGGAAIRFDTTPPDYVRDLRAVAVTQGRTPGNILDFNGIPIMELTTALINGAQASAINAAGCGITRLEAAGCIHSSVVARLSALYLDESAIRSSDFDALGRLTGLTRLYLSSSGLTEIPSAVASLPRLSELNIAGNAISTLAPLRMARRLRRLNASGNSLESFDGRDVARARSIDLSGNAIATVDNIGALSRATYLSLTGNALEELSAAGIDTLTSLVEIDLSHNLLRTVPDALFSLPSLLRGRLEGNPLMASVALRRHPRAQIDVT